MGKKPTLDWHFKAINPADYEIHIRTVVAGNILLIIFNKAKQKLARTKGKTINGNPDTINSFKIPPEYHNLIKTRLRKVVVDAQRELKHDKIEILSYHVKTAVFLREDKDWVISVVMEGQYVDKR
jgi:hypothetical protein